MSEHSSGTAAHTVADAAFLTYSGTVCMAMRKESTGNMAAKVASADIASKLARFNDIGVAGAILLTIGMLIIPIPDWVLDFGIALNLALAVVIVLITATITEPLDFSVFPSLLLLTTLYRLALNVAATRLILSTAQPGRIIEAFGNVVLGGNYVVGVIAFLILVIVNFVVITNGAGRVAEVAARFTLDAMPGKQMSIDADLNAGHITEEQARERRGKIESEADFYGAMDGASKFVRGDATAAILIIIVNIVGGFAMGMLNGQGDMLTVLQTYTILTVGEGLVSQIPALMISTATGLLVTRSGSKKNVAQDVSHQMMAHSRPILMAGLLLIGLFLVPGFPKLPILIVASSVLAIAYHVGRREKQKTFEQAVVAQREAKTAQRTTDDPIRLLNVDTLLLELGSNVVPLALPDQGGDLADRVGAARRQIALELGIVLPMVRIRDNLQLKTNEYVIRMRDQVIARNEVAPSQLLAIDSGNVLRQIQGRSTTEPAFGSPAIWITKAQREAAEMYGYIVAEPSSVIITHLTETIKEHAHELLTRQETQALIDHVKETNRVVVDELTPALLSLGEIQKVLQNLLRERVSIRDLSTVLEVLADWAPRTKDLDQLTECARAALARQICRQYADDNGALDVMTLEPGVERMLRENVQMTPTGVTLAIDPTVASQLVDQLQHQSERMAELGYTPILLCSSQIRLAVKRLSERTIPALSVLAYTEVVPNTDVHVNGQIALAEIGSAEIPA